MSNTHPLPADDFGYWRYRDLLELRIVSSRTDLHRKQRLFNFPRPIVLTGGRNASALFPRHAIKAWLAEREALGITNAVPKLKPTSRPRGRPRKNAA